LAAELVARLRSTGRFCDPLLVGPRRVYEDHVDCEIVDVEGTLPSTLHSVTETVRTRFAGDAPVAVISCDILPTATEVNELLSAEFDPHDDCHFWWQWVAADPQKLGASAWKPRYVIRASPDGELETVFPGHLAIFRPEMIRFEVLLRLLTLAYRYRNWTPRQRMPPMLVRGVGMMLLEDLRNLRRAQLPILTLSIPWHLLGAYRDLQKHRLTVPDQERHVAGVLLHRRFRHAERPVVIALTRILSFAQDIDTRDEFAAACARVGDG
jgi:hypothetical protein